MTIIASYIHDGSVWIASDSIGSDINLKYDLGSKIICVNDSYYVGFAASYRTADIIRESDRFPQNIRNINDARLFRDELVRAINEDYSNEKIEVTIILATQSGIYAIEDDFQLHSFENDKSYYCVGSGYEVGTGVLHLASMMCLEGSVAVRQAILAAISHVTTCGGSVHLNSVLLKETK